MAEWEKIGNCLGGGKVGKPGGNYLNSEKLKSETEVKTENNKVKESKFKTVKIEK